MMFSSFLSSAFFFSNIMWLVIFFVVSIVYNNLDDNVRVRVQVALSYAVT